MLRAFDSSSSPVTAGELTAAKRSLIQEAACIIAREIERGRWRTCLPGERPLSESLQISRSTLRLALKHLQSEGTIRAEQGRRRKVMRRGRRRSAERTPRIVMLSAVPLEKIEPYILLWLDHLREILSRRKIVFEVEVRPGCFNRTPSIALRRLIGEATSDVWLLLRSTREMQEWFVRRRLPHVVVGSTFESGISSSIDLDQYAVGRHAAGSFARLGHRRAAIFISNEGLAGDRDCLRGFLAEKDRRGSPLQVDVVQHDGAPGRIIQGVDRILGFRPRPSAIFSAGGMPTVTIMMRLAQRRVQVPDEMAIISRDDNPVFDFVPSPPARFQWHPLDFARGVYRQIKRQIAFPGETGRGVRLIPEFSPYTTLGSRRFVT